MSRCSAFETHITPYLDGELDDAARRELESHLVHCPPCRKLLAEQQAVRDFARAHASQSRALGLDPAWRRSDPEPGLPPQPRFRWARGAVMTAAAVCLTLAALWLVRPPGVSATGLLIDSTCAVEPRPFMADATAACVLGCIRNGAEFVLVVQGVAYGIRNQHMEALVAHAGQAVRVSGHLVGGEIKIASLTPAAR